jgi:predicted SprT family Zn-dependent metalloprotease
MIISEFNILAGFQVFNEKYFNGELPIPTVVIRHSYRTLGYFHCELDNLGNIINPIIEMTDNYDYTESQFRDILVHEMIHYYLVHNKKDMKCKHGKVFKKMANEFNSKYGMNITPTIDIEPYNIKEGNSNFFFKLCTLF